MHMKKVQNKNKTLSTTANISFNPKSYQAITKSR